MIDRKSNDVNCGKCLLAIWNDYLDSYTCHRYPPDMKKSSSGIRGEHAGVYEFRCVDPTDFCAEWIEHSTGETFFELVARVKKERQNAGEVS